MTGRRVPGAGDPDLPRGQARAAHRLRGHRRRHPRHQHGPHRLLPVKPWDPPEERLYPVLDDLLADWQACFRPPFEGMRVVGHRWSPRRLPDPRLPGPQPGALPLAGRRDRPRGPEAPGAAGEGRVTLPLVLLPDGTRSPTPRATELAEKIGFRTQAEQPFYDLMIVGGGPAGLAAAVYGASEGLRTLMVERDAPGGQAGTSSRIENYLGFPAGLSGADLARRGRHPGPALRRRDPHPAGGDGRPPGGPLPHRHPRRRHARSAATPC